MIAVKLNSVAIISDLTPVDDIGDEFKVSSSSRD